MTNDIKNQDRKYRPLVYVCSAYSGDVTLVVCPECHKMIHS